MRKFFWVMLGCLVQVSVQAASFDCAKARTPTEKTICGDAELSRLDQDLGQAYRKALQRGDTNGVRESQRRWLKSELGACKDAACMKKAYRGRLGELTASAPAPESAAPAAAAQQVAQKIPRLHLKTKPTVCKAVAEAVNRGEDRQLLLEIPEDGLLIDINGDGKKERVTFEEKLAYLDYSKVHVSTEDGAPIEFNPVPEEERDSELISERLIKFGDRFYIYGESYETPHYLAIIDKDNREKIVCEFGELKPIVTISSSRNDRLCKLGLEHKLEHVQFAGKRHGMEEFAGEDKKAVAGNFHPDNIIVEASSPNEAAVDIDNDGKPDRVIELHVVTGAANPPCAGDRLAVLDQSGRHLDKGITPLLPAFECMTGQTLLRFDGQSYIEVGAKITQLKGRTLSTICEFHSKRVFRVQED